MSMRESVSECEHSHTQTGHGRAQWPEEVVCMTRSWWQCGGGVGSCTSGEEACYDVVRGCGGHWAE